MKRLAFLLIFFLPSCGDVGSSSNQINIDAGGTGGQSSSVFDPIPTNCNITCSVTSSGSISASQNCEGGTVTSFTPPTLDDCDSIIETTEGLENEDDEEA